MSSGRSVNNNNNSGEISTQVTPSLSDIDLSESKVRRLVLKLGGLTETYCCCEYSDRS